MDNLVQKYNKLSEPFWEYLFEHVFISQEEKDLISVMMQSSEVFIFGGVARDYFFEKTKHRDIDLLVDNLSLNTINFFKNYIKRKTRFDGYNLRIRERIYDVWEIKNTWGLKYLIDNNYISEKDVNVERILDTTFFNITSILYSLSDKQFIVDEKFDNVLENRELDIVLDENPFPELCIVKAYEYLINYDLKPSKVLKEYCKAYFKSVYSKIDSVQKSHYGDLRFQIKDIEEYINKECIQSDEYALV